MFSPSEEAPSCERESIIYGVMSAGVVAGEDCGGRKRFRGSEPILLNAYNVGEPQRLVLNNLDGSERALGGRELAPLDQFPGESVSGIAMECKHRTEYKFCGGTYEYSCDCASSILSYLETVPKKLLCALSPEAAECREITLGG
jgi:hypothetical protein